VNSVVSFAQFAAMGFFKMLRIFLTPTDEIPIFVFVKHIIQVTNMWLICGIVYDAVCFNMHCHAYEFETTGEWVAFQAGQMLDNQCPSIYQYMSKLLVIMRHRVFRLQYFVVYSCITSFFGDFREFGCRVLLNLLPWVS